MLLVHLDSIATFSLDLLFDQHLAGKQGWEGVINIKENIGRLGDVFYHRPCQ